MKEMPVIADFLIVALTLLAPALGGSTFLWTQAILFLIAGLIIFAHPSRNVLARPLLWAALALVLLGASAFLPATMFPAFPWRAEFETKFDVKLPGLLTPQPWLTLEKLILLAGSLFWGAYLLTRGVSVRRRALLTMYAAGILGLTLVSFYFYFRNIRTTLWNPLNGQFGFFPNRNHTGNVLALGGIVMLALAQEGFLRRSKAGPLWLVGYLIVAAGLVVNYSRAGVALFFLGSAAWFCWVTWQQRRFKAMAIGASGLLFLLSAFFLMGGRTMERFLTKQENAEQVGFRWLVQTDALELYKDASWHGIGMANFRPIFPAYRKASANEYETIHPESDWLLAGIELGWLAPFIVWGTLGYLLWKRWPSSADPTFALRAAAVVAVIAFVVHGFVDVPGHRFGAVWPALFLLSIAQREDEFDTHRPWLSRFYRAGAFALCMMGIAWLLTSFGTRRMPNSAAVFDLKRDIMRAYDQGRHAEVVRLAGEGLRIAPLDWYFYYNRGLAEAWILSTPEKAQLDFARAYYLQPQTPELYYAEGRVWLERDPALAVVAWGKALSAAPPAMDEGLFQRMLVDAGKSPEALEWMRRLAMSDVNNYLKYLAHVGTEEFKTEVVALLEMYPRLEGLTTAQRKRLFEMWQRRDPVTLAAKLEANPAWTDAGWLPLADSLATRKDFQGAFSLAMTNIAKPTLPSSVREGSTEELERFVAVGNDIVSGYALYQRYREENRTDQALQTLRRFTATTNAPPYFHYLEAQAAAEMNDWTNAWRALRKYLDRTASR